MKKQTNKARIKREQLECLVDFIDTLNSRINNICDKATEIQDKINVDPDSVYCWDKEWLQGGQYDDQITAYQNLIKELEKLI